MQLTTKSAHQVWASPDGLRKIYELGMEYEGKPVKAKTYSEAIATVGWSGMVETYEKPGARGIETFVKQMPKESGSYSGKRESKPQDQFTMYLSYAKDIAVALIGAKAYTPEHLAEIVNDVALAGEQLYDAHNSEKDKVIEVPISSVPAIEAAFNSEPEIEPESPWPTPN